MHRYRPAGHARPDGRGHQGAREAEREYELAGQGRLLRLWALPGQGRSLALWRARNPAEMQAVLKSLPLEAWMTVQTTPLAQHPSDPAAAGT